MVPMAEELKHVQDYLEIEKARFEDKLEITYELPEQMEIWIPTLILQPVVENAVRYGIGKDGKRKVYIQIREEEDCFRVSIRDKGKGFPEEVIKKLENDETVGGSIGLNNVNQRMKRTYGKDHGVQIFSSAEGSSVNLCFMKKTKPGKGEKE